MGDERSVRLAHLPVERMLASQSDNSSETSVESMVRQGMQLRDIESEVSRQAARAALMLWTERQPDTPRTQVVKQVARSLGVSARTIYNKLNGVERLS
jgi:predicted DNA binding protein